MLSETCMQTAVSSLSIFHAGCIDTTCFKSLVFMGESLHRERENFLYNFIIIDYLYYFPFYIHLAFTFYS